jgi:hypothetical protein
MSEMAMSTATTRGTNHRKNFTVTGYLLDVIHHSKHQGYSERIILKALDVAKAGQARGKKAQARALVKIDGPRFLKAFHHVMHEHFGPSKSKLKLRFVSTYWIKKLAGNQKPKAKEVLERARHAAGYAGRATGAKKGR